MRSLIVLVTGLGVIAFVAFFYAQEPKQPAVQTTQETATVAAVTVIAKNLEIPWDIAFLPEGGLLVTERTGHVIAINQEGIKVEIPVQGVKKGGEGGLLGIVLHPNFASNRLLYLYMTTPGDGGQTQNRVVRYRYEGRELRQDNIIISGIPGAIYHDGGRMIYITTGDATSENIAQDRSSLGGKILRLRDDGSVPADNPFDTAVYSYGHRNPQGLAWDSAGRLWETEHGRSGIRSGLDEINLIKSGKNYGWPIIEGDKTDTGMTAPALHSGATTTWAPASAAILGNSLFFGGLFGESLYEAILEDERVAKLKVHFKGEFGRIRTVRVGPDGMLYLTTSNRDGRGDPEDDDDRIIRINPEAL
jgi:glucose/arabinose dehydrogenase